ncbi:MAG: nicotinate (nicotinamide) nucleotide adenylyltransferase [Endomicrobium sp.]|jgi:nicotinate-nucleotide adenylyltransferase|nr:nicotinate (nicotinamide) nucleotide adenylyltransferase [Endomicrobium sp.]
MRKIAIFGGSFDPIHKAHIQVAQLALQLYKLNTIFFVIAIKPPNKSIQYANIIDRINMLQIATYNLKHMKISLYEVNKHRTVYSYQTLDYFQRKYSKAKIYMIIGSDCVLNFHSWRNICYIKKHYNLIVINRPGVNISKNEINYYNCINDKVYDISSTMIRQLIKDKNNKASLYLNPQVYKYILKNSLYTK